MATVQFYVISTFDADGEFLDALVLTDEGGNWHLYDGQKDTVRPDDAPSFTLGSTLRSNEDAPLVIEVDLPPGVGPLTKSSAIFIANFLDNNLTQEDVDEADDIDRGRGARADLHSEEIDRVALEGAAVKNVPGAKEARDAALEEAQEEAAGALQQSDPGQPTTTASTLVRALPVIGAVGLVGALGWAVWKGRLKK